MSQDSCKGFAMAATGQWLLSSTSVVGLPVLDSMRFLHVTSKSQPRPPGLDSVSTGQAGGMRPEQNQSPGLVLAAAKAEERSIEDTCRHIEPTGRRHTVVDGLHQP
jgi:hypothetical protein